MSVWKYVKVKGAWRYKAAIEDKGKIIPNMVRGRQSGIPRRRHLLLSQRSAMDQAGRHADTFDPRL
jgi:hypothetical protein